MIIRASSPADNKKKKNMKTQHTHTTQTRTTDLSVASAAGRQTQLMEGVGRPRRRGARAQTRVPYAVNRTQDSVANPPTLCRRIATDNASVSPRPRYRPGHDKNDIIRFRNSSSLFFFFTRRNYIIIVTVQLILNVRLPTVFSCNNADVINHCSVFLATHTISDILPSRNIVIIVRTMPNTPIECPTVQSVGTILF